MKSRCPQDLKERAKYLNDNKIKAKKYAQKQKTIVSLIQEGDYYRIEKGNIEGAIELFFPY